MGTNDTERKRTSHTSGLLSGDMYEGGLDSPLATDCLGTDVSLLVLRCERFWRLACGRSVERVGDRYGWPSRYACCGDDAPSYTLAGLLGGRAYGSGGGKDSLLAEGGLGDGLPYSPRLSSSAGVIVMRPSSL